MARWNYKPSKPIALLTVPVGIAMIAFALTAFLGGEEEMSTSGILFLAFWCVMVVVTMGINLWAAFSERGSLGTFTSSDDPER